MPQELQVNSFERGMTDAYVNGARNAGEKFDNLLISKDRKPFSRPGSEVYLGANGKIPAGNHRINSFIGLNDDVIVASGTEIFHEEDDDYSELVGPLKSSPFSQDAFGSNATADNSQVSSAQWQDHAFVAQYERNKAKSVTYQVTLSTAEISNGGGDLLFTKPQHGLVNGDVVQFTSAGTLPGGITVLTDYYVVQVTADGTEESATATDATFKVSATEGGSAIAYVSDGTGCVANKTVISAVDTRSFPVKIYRDNKDDLQLRTAGLPDPKYIGNVVQLRASVNSLKTAVNGHIGTTGGGTHTANVPRETIQTANADTDDLEGLFRLLNEIRVKLASHIDDAEIAGGFGGQVQHGGIATSNADLAYRNDVFTLAEAVSLYNDLVAKYMIHRSDTGAHAAAPFGGTATAMTQIYITTAAAAGANTYIYAHVYKREYFVGNTLHIDRSPPHFVNITYATTPSTANPKTLFIRTLEDDFLGFGDQSWGTITSELYRTEQGQTVLKLVKAVGNTGSVVDDVPDASLGARIYTDGGVKPAGMPPRAKYFITANDVGWYLNCTVDGVDYPSRAYHSIPNDIDGVPEDFFLDVEGKIVGGGVVGINPIVMTDRRIYRFEGSVDLLGRGFYKKRVIDDTTGCISAKSITVVKDGLYFAGHDGFYFCDGFKCVQISQHLKKSYRVVTDRGEDAKIQISGAYNPMDDLVYWAMGSREADDNDDENSDIWVHDRYWGIPNSEGTFTNWLSGVNMRPTALTVINGKLYRGDTRGYVFKHDETLTEDPIVEVLSDPDEWLSRLVLADYTSCAFNFGSDYARKLCTRLLTVLEADTTASIQPWSINDDTGDRRPLKAIYNASDFTWGDPLWEWGDPDFVWRVDPTTFALRRFPKGTLRCTLKQVSYTNARKVKANSDNNGSVTVDATTKVITLASGNWTVIPDHNALVGGYIYFGDSPDFDINDGYEITAATVNTVTVSDLTNELVDGAQAAWIIVNYDQGDRLNLEGYTILYDEFGTSHTAYNVGDDGGNA